MNGGEPLYARRRLKELRALVRTNSDFEHTGPVHDAMISLLEDIADDLACRAEGKHVEAFHFMVRCMGVIAEANADEAYEPHGYTNPFAASPVGKAGMPEIEVWKWPVINRPPASAGSGVVNGAIFNEYSALKMFGYTVGKTEGWDRARRRDFLADFMTMALPTIVTHTFGNDYGQHHRQQCQPAIPQRSDALSCSHRRLGGRPRLPSQGVLYRQKAGIRALAFGAADLNKTICNAASNFHLTMGPWPREDRTVGKAWTKAIAAAESWKP